MRAILTLNAGSSSLKLGLFSEALETLGTGHVDRIGGEGRLKVLDGQGQPLPVPALGPEAFARHGAALATALEVFRVDFPALEIVAVGHRVVHGGTRHGAPERITEALMQELAALAPFAPLHQPHNLAGVRAALEAFAEAPQIACFDTAFHRNHPFVNDTFALPRSYYDKGVRRYGFHGLSYDYITGELARTEPALHAGRVVVAHLGSGASMCAIQGGRSVASTMGFSALDGLPMGTRSGQIDPGVLLYLMDQEGMTSAQISDLLYKDSGLKGLSGISNDMRELEGSDDPHAKDAIDYFTFRIRRELGGLAASMGGIDALVFCGGIGENSALVRARVCEGMEWIGITLDAEANAANAREIAHGPVRVLTIPTNEEIVIALAAQALLTA
ncbi:acetate/propionate family kinase [Pseudothioclava arenosa]|uniref:Acetate kinase n=1 Tax=Pseudothioclava arenosa TaxID=1795308 RepID=A0A2A4CQR2_9RHOB|nr:acetate/propionate family kinase [Pseudothioclava arenosa]PCD77581.1 acetate kinase [Pseudothioclava arenosa]